MPIFRPQILDFWRATSKTSCFYRFLSLSAFCSKLLNDCGVENHYKTGKALSSVMKADCPYVHTKYVNEGRFPQWLNFVVQDEVETLPPLMEFYGPMMATLRGESYASDTS